MLVRAAIAAYEPPLAFVPQMAIAAKRPPTSRAVFAATEFKRLAHLDTRTKHCFLHARPLGENAQIAVPLSSHDRVSLPGCRY